MRDVELHENRRDLIDGDERRRVVGLDQIARLVGDSAGFPGDGRGDFRIAQLQARLLEFRLIGGEQTRILIHQCLCVLVVLGAHVAALDEIGHAFGIGAIGGEFGLVLFDLALILRHDGLEGFGVYDEKKLAGLYLVAFGEKHLQQHARDLGTHGDAVAGFDNARGFNDAWNRAAARAHYVHAEARCIPAGVFAGRLGDESVHAPRHQPDDYGRNAESDAPAFRFS